MLSRILLEYLPVELSTKRYFVHLNPSYDLQWEAHLFKTQCLEDVKWSNIQTFEDAIDWHIRNDLLDSNYESRLEALNRQRRTQLIEYYQIALTRNEEQMSKLHRRLRGLNGSIAHLEGSLSQIRQNTREGLADSLYEEYILCKSVFSRHKRRLKVPLNKINHILLRVHESHPLIDELRLTARSHKCQTLWSVKRAGLFPKIPNELQIVFMSYLNLYKNLSKNPDCPPDHIIEDDFALDGWLISKNKPEPKKISSKVANREHVFITAKDQDEANEIYASNNPQAKLLQKARLRALDKGSIKESDFKKKTAVLQ